MDSPTTYGATAVSPADASFELLPLRVSTLGFDAGGETLLADVNFTLERQGRTCVVGPNGAGKSLLLRLCHGLLRPTRGEARWAGGSVAQQRRAQAMVFQRPALLRRSVQANVEHALAARDTPRGERHERASEVLFLHNGRLVEHSPVESFLDAPGTKLGAAFVEGRLLW